MHWVAVDVLNSVYRSLKTESLVNSLGSPVPQTTRLHIDDYLKRFHSVVLEINHRGDFLIFWKYACGPFGKFGQIIYAEKRIFAIVFYHT